MSYINFSLTQRFAAGAAGPISTSETLRAGFSRVGGRLETLEKVTSSQGPLPPRTHKLLPDVELSTAAVGVMNALQGASWVQDVLVDHGDGAQPATVSWTHRNGGAGTGLAGALPDRVQSVLDAAAVLNAVVTDTLTVRTSPL